MARPRVAARYIPPQRWARGITINEEAVASWVKDTKRPLKEGKGKGKEPIDMKLVEESINTKGGLGHQAHYLRW